MIALLVALVLQAASPAALVELPTERAHVYDLQGRNNGVLLLIAPNERQARIEVGYGLEPALPDVRAAQIIRYEIVPRFREGDLDGGVTAGVRAILGAIEGTYTPSVTARARGAWWRGAPTTASSAGCE